MFFRRLTGKQNVNHKHRQAILYALPDAGGKATRALLASVLSPLNSVSLRQHAHNDTNQGDKVDGESL